MTEDITDFIRKRAERLRTTAADPRKALSEDRRDQMVYAARQLEVTADEIDADFHVRDEEE